MSRVLYCQGASCDRHCNSYESLNNKDDLTRSSDQPCEDNADTDSGNKQKKKKKKAFFFRKKKQKVCCVSCWYTVYALYRSTGDR